MNVHEVNLLIKRVSRLSLSEKESYRSALHKKLLLHPRDVQSNVELAIYYISIKDFKESMKHLKTGILLEPGNEYLWFVKGMIFEESKYYENALEAYYRAYRLGSEMAQKKIRIFCSNAMKLNLGDRAQKIVDSFEESLC